MQVDLRARLDVQSQVTHVADDAGYGLPISLLGVDAGSEPFAYRILIRPETPGRRFIDHYEPGPARHVLFGDESAFEQRYSHRPKIVVAGAAEIYFWPVSGLNGLAFYLRGGRDVVERAQRQSRDRADRDDFRERFEAGFKLAVKLGAPLRLTRSEDHTSEL